MTRSFPVMRVSTHKMSFRRGCDAGSIITVSHQTKVWRYTCICHPIICWCDKMSECKCFISKRSGTRTNKKRKVINVTFKWQWQVWTWLQVSCGFIVNWIEIKHMWCRCIVRCVARMNYEPSIQHCTTFLEHGWLVWLTWSAATSLTMRQVMRTKLQWRKRRQIVRKQAVSRLCSLLQVDVRRLLHVHSKFWWRNTGTNETQVWCLLHDGKRKLTFFNHLDCNIYRHSAVINTHTIDCVISVFSKWKRQMPSQFLTLSV